MKNRRRLEVLLAAILIVSLLGGCGQNEVKKGRTNTAYYLGEAVWPYKDSDHYTAPNEATVTVNGITYTGTYDKSDDLCFPLPYVFHYYEGDGFLFGIGAHDGKCYSLLLDDYPEVEVCTFDATHGRETADAIAIIFPFLGLFQLINGMMLRAQ